ncbi:hypothetical protein LR48_Vigan06g114000 [Vigna angularis]|uniref:Uncharacterized protein n=1 Tax=Phaseolus angularis TaxID=3914 RepID=A0A0L9UTG0_PHAAN|nr:hypothetical protein LR48_Vigan06g114000 [Vigna angularis]
MGLSSILVTTRNQTSSTGKNNHLVIGPSYYDRVLKIIKNVAWRDTQSRNRGINPLPHLQLTEHTSSPFRSLFVFFSSLPQNEALHAPKKPSQGRRTRYYDNSLPASSDFGIPGTENHQRVNRQSSRITGIK